MTIRITFGDRTLDRAGDAVERVVYAHLRRPNEADLALE